MEYHGLSWCIIVVSDDDGIENSPNWWRQPSTISLPNQEPQELIKRARLVPQAPLEVLILFLTLQGLFASVPGISTMQRALSIHTERKWRQEGREVGSSPLVNFSVLDSRSIQQSTESITNQGKCWQMLMGHFPMLRNIELAVTGPT